MKTREIMRIAVVICVVAGFWLQNNKTKVSNMRDVNLSNITAFMDTENNGSGSDDEKGGGILDWWNRKDYICIDVQCVTFAGNYDSSVSQKVEDGTGTEAHSWSCPGCGGNGYIVNTEKA